MLCVRVSVLLLPLPLPLALTVNAFGLRCSRSYYVHFVPQLPQRVARSRCRSFSLSLSPSFPLSFPVLRSLCVFSTGHAPDGSLMTERMTRVHSTSTSPSVQLAQNFCRFPLAVKCCCLAASLPSSLAACCVPTLLLPFPSGLSVDFINLSVTH